MVNRILVVDDHPAFRAGARRLLERGPFTVVGEAADGRAAIEAARALAPDVVLLDVALPDTDGFHVAAELGAFATPPAVVLVSTRDAADYGDRVVGSGVRGFITKSALSIEAIEAMLR